MRSMVNPKHPPNRPSSLPLLRYPIAMSLRLQLAWVIGIMTFASSGAAMAGVWLGNRDLSPSLLPMLVWGVAVAVLSAFTGFFLSRILINPVDELTRGLVYLRGTDRSLAELQLPKPQARPPLEVSQLREGFSDLLHHIKGLLEAREATYAALTHDLKTPMLASIRALEYLERTDDLGPERRKEVLHELRDELGRSYQLVENLLVASRLEVQKPQLEVVNLRALLDDMRLRYVREAERRGIRLQVEGNGQARADRNLLDRAITNLSENALRHAKKTLTLRAGEGWLEVEDDGPGLPMNLALLTQPFRSVQLRGVRAGTAGLGLYVAKRVAEVHGGKLESLDVAAGTKLRLSLG